MLEAAIENRKKFIEQSALETLTNIGRKYAIVPSVQDLIKPGLERDDWFSPKPIETDGHYNAFVEYLETKDSPKAKRLLERLKALKDTDEFWYFKEQLMWDVFIEIS